MQMPMLRGGLIGLAAVAAIAAWPMRSRAQPPGVGQSDYGPGVGQVTVFGLQRWVYEPETGRHVRADSVSMVVSLGDLDLTSRYGAYEARQRIDRAARSVCEEASDVYLNDGDIPGGCYPTAVRQAIAQVEYAAGYPILEWAR
jgi:UrcA family protein